MSILKKFLVTMLLATQESSEPKDSISDKLRYEIAATQRDYLVAKQQLDQVLNKLRIKLDEANKICSAANKQLDNDNLVCIDKVEKKQDGQK